MRGVSIALLVLLSSVAAAHSFDPTLLVIEEQAAGAYRVRVAGGPRTIKDPARLVRWPAGCVLDETSTLRCDGAGLRGRTLSLEPAVEPNTELLVRVAFAGAVEVSGVLSPSAPALHVPAAPTFGWFRYIGLGIHHILVGIDHVMFVLAMVLAIASRRRLVLALSAFTVGHSLTLALASLGMLTLPSPPVEVLIALSLVALAAELLREKRESSAWTRRPWLLAGCFGLLHGLGFAGALADVGLPRGDLLRALVSFNAGVELGQLAIVAAFIIVLRLLASLRAQLVARPAFAYVVGTTGAILVIERAVALVGAP
jgi:hydrogenase/urease accessory protein HupE